MRRLLSIVLALGLVLSFSLVTAVPVMAFTEVWVDDDAPGDPGPGDLFISDPLENGTPARPFDEIQEAIAFVDLDLEGGIVHVLDGTYFETIDLVGGVDVLGAGAGVTIIDGGADSQSVVTVTNVGSGTVFDGFTITHGSVGVGGGMRLDNSSLTVTNCIFTENSASLMGGGMYILNTSSPVVANCIFDDNEVTGLNGGGICCWGNGSSTIINNTIVNNTANDNGGGIYVSPGSSPIITNNIIVGNTAVDGGGIYSDTAALPTSFNNVWGNSLNEYVNCVPSNSISVDPLFDDPGPPAYDYHLDSDPLNFSPCIDAGNNGALSLPATDFEGEPRVFDGDDNGTATVDMGADEYYVPPPPGGTVGGEVYPVDKTALLLPWLSLGLVLILAAGGLTLIRRLKRQTTGN